MIATGSYAMNSGGSVVTLQRPPPPATASVYSNGGSVSPVQGTLVKNGVHQQQQQQQQQQMMMSQTGAASAMLPANGGGYANPAYQTVLSDGTVLQMVQQPQILYVDSPTTYWQ